MSVVDIRVDLPSYSHSFTVSVQGQASVLDIKQKIQLACPGQPAPHGQRLIHRGRLLTDNELVSDLWKSDPRAVQLAVHPSAWTSEAPQIPGAPASPSMTIPPSSATFPANMEIPEPSLLSTDAPVHERPMMTYVVHLHQKALAALSPSIPAPSEPEFLNTWKIVARDGLEQYGLTMPSIFDRDFPTPSLGGLKYEPATVGGQTYLQLLNPGEVATPRQEHALQVLTYTFTLLTMTLPPLPPTRNIPTESVTVPPHVNQLLQQMGLPPLRAANGNIVPPIGDENNVAAFQLREIPLRQLFAPILLLIFRTLLLLYFFAPTRKPFLGFLLIAWVLYEIWRPINIALQQLGRRNPQEAQGPVGGQNDGAPNPLNPPAQGAAGPNAPAGGLPPQATTILDTLAQLNLTEEERILNASVETSPSPEPSLAHKAFTFVSLLFSTLHPAVWNSRRTALRRREGTIRTEANMRNAPPPEETEGNSNQTSTAGNRVAEVREELRARFNRQPSWIQQYMQRVAEEEWLEDLD